MDVSSKASTRANAGELAAGAQDRVGGGKREALAKRHERRQVVLLRLGEQIPRPREGRLERDGDGGAFLRGRQGAQACCSRSSRVRLARHPDPRRRQQERERQTVEGLHYGDDVGDVLLVEGEAAPSTSVSFRPK